jgi:DNA (cytosine-5)-methyltransferase 1
VRPHLLDLFCGAGGASMGFHRAGWEVTGVDHVAQPRYPFRFILGDALEVNLGGYDCIAASPPCQGYSRLRHLPWLVGKTWPLLIDPIRERLRASGALWVIENVEDAPLQGVMLCGQSFGLPLYRHRRFESNVLLLAPPHLPHRVRIGGKRLNDRRRATASGYISVVGHQGSRANYARALAIDWMTATELAQAIPPAYTSWLGTQLLHYVGGTTVD